MERKLAKTNPFAGNPGSTPSNNDSQVRRAASRVVNTGANYVRAARVTPRNNTLRASAAASSTAPPVVPYPQLTTPATRTVPTTTPGGGLAVPATAVPFMAPQFGRGGYLMPSPVGMMFPFGGFHPGMAPGFAQMPQGAFFAPQMGFVQDPSTGIIYPVPAMTPSPMVDHPASMGHRSVSAVPFNPAAQQPTVTPSEAIQPRRSVTFADPIAQVVPAPQEPSDDTA